MDIVQRCQDIQAQVEAELAVAVDAPARTEVLVQGLYRLNEAVLGEMGPPGRSERYLKAQAAALDLIVFLCLPLVRGEHGSWDLVSLLVEVGEGSQDPVLQKKLTGYARQLLVRQSGGADCAEGKGGASRRYLAGMTAGICLVTTLLLVSQESQRRGVLSLEAPSPPLPGATLPMPPPPPRHAPPAPQEPVPFTADGGAVKRTAMRVEKTEQITRIRLVANQVLVPATVRNGGESVRVTLLLDTGSTRTALNERLASRLGIDLSRAKGSLVEVADGRVLHSKLAHVDLLSVGARNAPSFEMEFFPYNGSEQGFDGFLGMDFLSRQRYQIDVEHEVIRWF